MAPLPPVQNVLRIRMLGVNGQTPWFNGYYWHYNAATLLTGDVNAICQGFATAWSANLATLHGITVQLQRVEGIDLRAPDAAQGGVDANITGSRTGAALPVQAACVASWKVNYRWRGGHFRTYHPLGVITDITGGRLWSSSSLTTFNAAFDAYFAALQGIQVGGVGGHLTGVRYIQNSAPLVTPLDLPVTDVTIHSRIDTQRRRLGKEGV